MSRFEELKFDRNRKRVKYCPCGKSNKDGKFCPYVGYEDKGYCHSCGETFLPRLASEDSVTKQPAGQKPPVKKAGPPSTIPTAFFVKTLNSYKRNNFVIFLRELVGVSVTKEAVSKYFIGTSDFWPNATVYWQITKDGKGENQIRGGKIIQYNIVPSNASFIGKDCKRNKDNYLSVKWIHKLPQFNDYNLVQCFFGEHLLTDDFSIPIGIVEAEKTAIIASIYLPQFTWLAAGSLTGLSLRKCKILRGRKIILFPDLNGFKSWTEKAQELSTIATVKVSDLLQKKATEAERKSGLDLADYLIRFDYKTFNNKY